MSQSWILQTKALSRRFGGVTAVDNVDLAVEAGELRCIIGPNGAGKSTLFKCLTHQLQPSSGHILLNDENLAGLQPHEIARRGVAIKNQIPSVYGGLSVRENVWLSARRKHTGPALDAIVGRTLEEIGYAEPSSAAQIVNELSHAHRQWVELGMLLASEPTVALLDEPTAGMTRDEMLKTVRIIKRLNQSATVIVVEHDLEFISLLAKRVTVLHQGRILMEDSMDRVANDPVVRDIYLGSQWKQLA